jgi:hypothetical protein
MLRKFIPAVCALVSGLTILLAALPSQVAYACLPCACPQNRSLNCYGDFAIYTNTLKNGDCEILVLGIDHETGKPREAIRATAKELAKLPELPEENTLIEQYYEFALYKLTTGEYQLNVGPDAESKVFVVQVVGCPATAVHESTFIAEPPPAQ